MRIGIAAIAGLLAACAPAPSPIATVEYESTFIDCTTKANAIAVVQCMNVRQKPLFAGNEEMFARLVPARLRIAQAVQAGRMDPDTGLKNIIELDIAAHREISGKVVQYNRGMENLAYGLQNYSDNLRQQQMHQQTLNALNRPARCTSTADGYGRVNTTCW